MEGHNQQISFLGEDKKRWKSCPSQSSGVTEKTLALGHLVTIYL
jgi:hypothetical protein